MALSEDQKAMLKLVSQPGTSYEDIAALMGLSVEQVRTKVDAALKQLDQGDAAPAPPPAAEEPEAPVEEKASEPVEEKFAPPAPKPKPKPAKPKAPPAPKPKPARPKTPLSLPDDRGARWGLIAGGAVVLVIVLLLVTGVLGGGDDTTGSPPSGGASALGEGSTTDAAGQPEPTGAVLKATEGGDSSGRAVFARSGKNVLLLLSASGLEPSPKGRSYTVSLSKSAGERVPLIATRVGDSGKIGGQFQVAAQVLGLLASGYDEMEVSLVPDDELAGALKTAQQNKKAPTYGGTTFMQGPVTGPIVEGQG
jgi:Sigma-70, region 4